MGATEQAIEEKESTLKLTVQYFDDCPNWTVLVERIQEVTGARPELTLTLQKVETTEQAELLGFVGSPTLLINGHDPFVQPGLPAGLACRMYLTPEGPAGLPSLAQLAEVLAP